MREYPRFLDTGVVGEDQFESGSHRTISDAIAALMTGDKLRNKLIGLEGPWGSGKSNVIKMLAEKLVKTHYFFTYDAWGHQEDNHRQIFLEELTTKLVEDDVIQGKYKGERWEDKKKKLTSKYTVKDTETVPKLSAGVVVASILLVISPIFAGLSAVADSSCVKILLLCAPIIIGVLFYLVGSLLRCKIIPLHELMRIYSDKAESVRVSESIYESGPSVNNFIDWMKSLSDSIVDKTIVVVFDNMDRLPEDKVKELWSSVHTFFAETSYDRIQVIVPFDRTHLGRVFNGDRDKSEEYIEQFITKTFSLVFRVSEPMLSDWQAYFRMKFREAYGDRSGQEEEIVVRLYSVLSSERSPRSIISFVNNMVSSSYATDSGVELKYIALFILCKNKLLANPMLEIISLQFVCNVKALFPNIDDLQASISAVAYQVPLEKAAHISLTAALESVFKGKIKLEGDKYAISIHFVEALCFVIDHDRYDAIVAIGELDRIMNRDGISSDTLSKLQPLWHSIAEKYIDGMDESVKMNDCMRKLATRCEEGDVRSLISKFADIYWRDENADASVYHNNIQEIMQIVKPRMELNISAILSAKTVSPMQLVDLLSVAKEEYKLYNIDSQDESIHKYIEQILPEDLDRVETFRYYGNSMVPKVIVDGIEDLLADGSKLTADNLGKLYEVYRLFAPKKRFAKPDPDIIDQLLTEVAPGTSSQYELIAMLLPASFTDNELANDAIENLIVDDEFMVAAVSERLQYYIDYGDILLGLSEDIGDFEKAVARKLVVSKEGWKLGIGQVLKSYDEIRCTLNVPNDVIVSEFDRLYEGSDIGIQPEAIPECFSDPSVLLGIVEVRCRLTNDLFAVIHDHIESIDENGWYKIIINDTQYYRELMCGIVNRSFVSELPSQLKEAYKRVLLDHAKGEVDAFPSSWQDCINEYLSMDEWRTTAKYIRDIFVKSRHIDEELFMQYGDIILVHLDMTHGSEEVLRAIIAPVLRCKDCLDIIIENLDKLKIVYDKSADDRDDFINKLRSSFIDPDLQKYIVAIATKLDIAIEDREGNDERVES